MADTRFYASDVQMPIIDYGAIYENAKAKREESETRKLQYLNSFQKERGALAPGVQGEVQSMWDKLQEDLNSGDMSFEAMARRQQMYNNYKDQAAAAIEWSNKLNEYEATILADPSTYNTPDLLLKKIQEDRNRNVPLSQVNTELSSYPSIGTFRRFSMAEMAPTSAAQSILSNLKTGGGLQNFYDMDGRGGIQPEVVNETVMDFFGANSLSKEEEDQAIAFVLRSKGALSGAVTDIEKVRNIPEEQRVQYLSEYSQYVSKSLMNLIANDIETQKEEEAARLRVARAQANITASSTNRSADANTFGISTGPVTYMPPIKPNEKGELVITPGAGPITDDSFVMSAKVTDTQPSYVDVDGTKKYVEQIAVDKDGNQFVMVRFDQDVIDTRVGRSTKATVRNMVPWAEVIQGAGSGLSNTKQAAKIQATFNRMGVATPTPAAPSTQAAPSVIKQESIDDVVSIMARNTVTGMDAYGNPVTFEVGNISNPGGFSSRKNSLKEVEALVQEYKNSDPDDEMRQDALARRVNRLGAEDRARYRALTNQNY
jgi:hypothetical protein